MSFGAAIGAEDEFLILGLKIKGLKNATVTESLLGETRMFSNLLAGGSNKGIFFEVTNFQSQVIARSDALHLKSKSTTPYDDLPLHLMSLCAKDWTNPIELTFFEYWQGIDRGDESNTDFFLGRIQTNVQQLISLQKHYRNSRKSRKKPNPSFILKNEGGVQLLRVYVTEATMRTQAPESSLGRAGGLIRNKPSLTTVMERLDRSFGRMQVSPGNQSLNGDQSINEDLSVGDRTHNSAPNLRRSSGRKSVSFLDDVAQGQQESSLAQFQESLNSRFTMNSSANSLQVESLPDVPFTPQQGVRFAQAPVSTPTSAPSVAASSGVRFSHEASPPPPPPASIGFEGPLPRQNSAPASSIPFDEAAAARNYLAFRPTAPMPPRAPPPRRAAKMEESIEVISGPRSILKYAEGATQLLVLSVKARDMKHGEEPYVRGKKRSASLSSRLGFRAPDPFYEVINSNGEVVARSEVMMRNQHPTFPPLRIPMDKLDGGKLLLKFLGFNRNGLHSLMGQFPTTVAQLQRSAKQYRALRHSNKKKQYKDPSFVLFDPRNRKRYGKIFVTDAIQSMGTVETIKPQERLMQRAHSDRLPPRPAPPRRNPPPTMRPSARHHSMEMDDYSMASSAYSETSSVSYFNSQASAYSRGNSMTASSRTGSSVVSQNSSVKAELREAKRLAALEKAAMLRQELCSFDTPPTAVVPMTPQEQDSLESD